MKQMTSIENKRFEIREPIRSFLLTVKKYFSYDACALYLITAPGSMHKNEKEGEFKKRFPDGKIEFEYSDQIINDSTSRKGCVEFTGKKLGVDKKNGKYCFSDKDGNLKYIEDGNIINLATEDPDAKEKIKLTNELVRVTYEKDKLANAIDKVILYDEKDTPYKVLKFIGVEDSYGDEKEKKHHWIYDYKTRPNKYILFDRIDDIVGKKVKYIKGEGITAMVGRLNFNASMKENQIYDKNGDGSKNENSIGGKVRGLKDDTERGIHNKCKELMAIPVYDIVSNEIKGVIRLDNYNDLKADRNKVYEDIIKLTGGGLDDIEIKGEKDLFAVIIKLCLQVIDVSNGMIDKGSYNDLFQGKRIINAILDIGEKINIENKSNKNIYELTKHLFFVFQRHTYVGYEEIMARTMFYIKDVFRAVGMERYYDLTEKKLFDFMDHEKLMLYSTQKYRDHFMHQFHVFVMGYIIINAIGIDKIKERINKRLENVEDYKGIKIDDEGVLRIWVLISLFHDIAYIFQRYDKTMQRFISDNLLTDIPVHIDWGIIFSSTKNKVSYINTMSELTKFFTSPDEKMRPNRHFDVHTNKTELLKNYIQAIEDSQDHGVLSAILLINLFMKTIDDSYIGDHKAKGKRIVELYLAALAISMHNSCTYKTLKESTKRGYISFDSFPLEFVLMYCDTAQEWGRKKEVDKVFYDAPVLSSIEINLVEQEDKEQGKSCRYGASKIMCQLKYEGLNHPDEEKLNSFFLEKLSKFRSDNVIFGIQYKYETSDKETTFYFSCNDDDEKVTKNESSNETATNKVTPNEAIE